MPDADARAEVQQALQRTAPLWLQGGEAAELAAHTVRAYLSNVLDHPTRLEYRRVKESGSAFKNRVACCPGALSVLAATGWSREQYPDAIYWVLKEVRELDLREVVRELDLGIAAASRLSSARAAAAEEAAAAAVTATRSRREADAVMQLRARAAVHAVKARADARPAPRSVRLAAGLVCCWLLLLFAFHCWAERSVLWCSLAAALALPPPPLHRSPGAAGAATTALLLLAGALAVARAKRRNSWRPREAEAGEGGADSGEGSTPWLRRPRRLLWGVLEARPGAVARCAAAALALSLAAGIAREEMCLGGAAAAPEWAASWARLSLGLPACGADSVAVAAGFRAAALSQHPDKLHSAAGADANSWARLAAAVLSLRGGRVADVLASADALRLSAPALEAARAERFRASRQAYDLLRAREDQAATRQP